MNEYRSHRDLTVWQKSMDLAVACYGLARELPWFERYGLAPQMRRAAVSIPANIAEGYGQRTRKQYGCYLVSARGSARELDTHLELAVRCELLKRARIQNGCAILDEVTRMLTTMVRKLDQP